jgi:hypothetical protein
MSFLRSALDALKSFSSRYGRELSTDWIDQRTASSESFEIHGEFQRAIDDALTDPLFRDLVTRQCRDARKLRAEIARILVSEALRSSFLSQEMQLLKNAGVSEDAARFFIKECDNHIPLEMITDTAPEVVFHIVEKLRDNTRNVQIMNFASLGSTRPTRSSAATTNIPAASGATAVQAKTPAISAWAKTVIGAAHGVFGLAVIGLNGTALASTLGLSSTMSAASGGLGTVACSRGYNRLSEGIEELIRGNPRVSRA